MGNEVSRPAADVSPQGSGVVNPATPSTPTGSSRRSQSFTASVPSNPRKERNIQRMDKAIRRRVRGGVTYNMKLLLRGAKGTGKTSLFQRLQGQPIPEAHESTAQLQTATINWSFRNLEENVRCEVWDVVDKGFLSAEDRGDSNGVHTEELGLNGGLEAAVASSNVENGTHTVAVVDASTVDVYQEAHGVIFLLDVTKWDTLEYVKQQLEDVPAHIPTLVLGNFRDFGAERKIFKEDIETLLYGSKDRPQHQQWKRPTELLYFECSLLNCYGLKSLHQYFGIPFLQLKLATIRQQMRIVEGEFSHLKHDLQEAISDQRYAEYIEHIRATGSDIRTGRRISGGSTPPKRQDSGKLEKVTYADQKSDGTDDVNIVATQESGNEGNAAAAVEDLPARSSFKAAVPLKFEHKETKLDEVPKESGSTTDAEATPAAVTPAAAAPAVVTPPEVELTVEQVASVSTVSDSPSSRPRKASVEEVTHLEDFQAPKARVSDLEGFYSEDESDEEEVGNDVDVVVTPVDGGVGSTSGAFHKQQFLDSDSEEEEDWGRSRKTRKSPHRPVVRESKKTLVLQPSPSTQEPSEESLPSKDTTDPNSSTTGSMQSPGDNSATVDGEAACGEYSVAADEAPATVSVSSNAPDTLPVVNDDEDGAREDSTTLETEAPIPDAPSLLPSKIPSIALGTVSSGSHRQVVQMNGSAMETSGDDGGLSSLSALQSSLPIPGQSASTSLQLSDLRSAAAPSTHLPDFTAAPPSNDLEAFLNESDSDSDDATANRLEVATVSARKQTVESSDEDEEDADRFAKYTVSKKTRSERRRRQKEDMKQLNAALDKTSVWEDGHSAGGVSASDASFATVDVMEAIRKAQEEAARMLPAASAPADDDADAPNSSRKHKHKHSHRKVDKDGKKKSRKSNSRKHHHSVTNDIA